MAKKKEIITEDGHVFDSHEELYFYWWVKELMDNGYIEKFTPQPKSFDLSGGLKMPYIKEMKRVENKELWHTIMHPSVYTCDAFIIFTEKGYDTFTYNLDSLPFKHYKTVDVFNKPPKSKSIFELLISRWGGCFIEVKPDYDQNNMTTLARTNIKWVWEKHGEFVNLVIPQKLFAKTFTPKRYLTNNKAKTARKIKFKVRSLQEFIGTRENNQTTLM